ncbi:ATP-binding cassette domain-containing protein [Microcoleus sp. FACHB-672]|uniref:ATP-binding cassette domain-containing protein n=1 Tax=Microcoleus sp. FACHB-672 TaxID=2692825 RepID=UPI0016869CA2|nr:ATP-binding cassette domain-containing protein [Microcoleus sp. FACHB-672]MBD2043162.1 ATP-binding cassette domain-containing protein [Microcoleus sp. FACHB-672]
MTGNTEQSTIISKYPYLQLNNQGHLIKLELKQDRHILGRAPEQADLVVPPDWRVISASHAVLRKAGDDYCIYDGDTQNPSTNGLFLDRTRITPSEGHHLRDGTEIRIGQDPRNQILLTYFNPFSRQPLTPPREQFVFLKNRSVLLGRDPSATLQLDAPTVSRRHATIEPVAQGGYQLQDYSANGVFVNGQKVTNSAHLAEGATVRIGPFTLVLRGDRLEVLDQGNQIRLDAEGLAIHKRLDNISLAIEPGQFVALVGGSGAGKSTLMRTLLGIEQTTAGKVYLNGDDLRTNFNIYRTQIGYVPQDDIIHRELTVAEVLTYAAQLRLPPDLDVETVVEKTLADIEMSHRRSALVSDLSGGQRKRVSIGVELLADPKLFFLDEPTSGLDPGLDKKMMLLLRKLADQGRTIVLVTHATANIKLCDRVVFLGRGGHLCFFGPPKEAFDFFEVKTEDFADIYNKLEENDKAPLTFASRFGQSPYYKQYVENHLSRPAGQPQQPAGVVAKQVNPSPFKQLSLLAQRYFKLTGRDPVNLSLALLTAPIGISLITLAIRYKNPLILGDEPDPTLAPLALRVLFVFTCAAIWVGLSTSLQEIVKESAIYLRERLVNLGLFPYLGSKVLILGGLALLQTLLMVGVILIGFKSPQPDLILWPVGLGITTFLTLLTSMSLGLMVSAIVKNGSQANSALPLLLLPQIIFSGVLFKMEGLASKLSWLMLSRWSVGAYGALVNVNGMVPEPTKLPDGSTIPQPFEPSAVYDPTWENLGLNWGLLCLHTAVYLGVTWWMQKRKDIF